MTYKQKAEAILEEEKRLSDFVGISIEALVSTKTKCDHTKDVGIGICTSCGHQPQNCKDVTHRQCLDFRIRCLEDAIKPT